MEITEKHLASFVGGQINVHEPDTPRSCGYISAARLHYAGQAVYLVVEVSSLAEWQDGMWYKIPPHAYWARVDNALVLHDHKRTAVTMSALQKSVVTLWKGNTTTTIDTAEIWRLGRQSPRPRPGAGRSRY